MVKLAKVALGLCLWGLVAFNSPAMGQVPVDQHSVFISGGAGFQGNRFYTSTWRPSYHAHLDYAVVNNLTIGLEGSYYGEKIAKESRFDSYSVGLRSSYYVNSLLKRTHKKNNYYAGVSVLYYSYKYTDFSATKGRAYVPVHIGLKRNISSHLGAYSELSFNDMGFLKLGLTAKL